MKLIINPTTQLQGEATPPGSKSHTVRALLLATLAKGKSFLSNALNSDDAKAAIGVCEGLGAQIITSPKDGNGLDITVESNGVPLQSKARELFTMSSGITTTFVLPVIGLRQNADQPLTLKCSEQMMKRPLDSIIRAVNLLGMDAKSLGKNESCPLQVTGALQGGYAAVNGKNSQYLSALLMALPCAPGDSKVEVKHLQERPYVDMTLSWLDGQQIRYDHHRHEDVDTFRIFGRQEYQPFTKTIPGDFSSASYVIAAAVLLPGKVVLHGLDMDDPQGDKRTIAILQQMGADIHIAGTDLVIEGGKPLKGTTIDCNDIPDMLPTLAVIGTQAEGKTTLFNVGNARIKETDRIKSMALELQKMGARVEEHETSLIIHKSKLYCARLHGYNDHRTIMALAVAALIASKKAEESSETEIDTAEGINKTFPNFVSVMTSLGAKMRMIP